MSDDVIFGLVRRCSTADQWDTATGLGVGSSYGDGERRSQVLTVAARERARGEERHGGEKEKPGGAWRRQRRPGRRGGKQAGWRWRACACVRRAHALVLLAEEEEDRGRLLGWAGFSPWPGKPGEVPFSLSFLFFI